MNQFYPNAVRSIAMDQAQGSGGLVTPPEENFNTDTMRGSLQQILSDNLGAYVSCEFLVGLQAMIKKAAAVRASKRAFVLFARGGFDSRLLQFAKTDDRVRLVSLEDLYR